MKLRVGFVIVSLLSALVCTTLAQTAASNPIATSADSPTATTLPPASVTGTGTKNFVPLWTGATTLGNSVIYETGGNVGIGTKKPKAIVDVAGKAALGMQVTVPGSEAAIDGVATDPKAGTTGVYGQSSSPIGNGVFGVDKATTGGAGVIGQTENTDSTGTAGIFVAHGGGGFILGGYSGTNYNLEFTVDANGNGFYAGNLNVKGTLTKGGGSFKIDHPLDPANKYLSHSFVESPDMMNVYNGNITTDRHGLATVTLPDYFEALNQDFRYQLTVIGQFAQAIVKREIENNRFTIKTNRPLVKVSWQVTGIRHDAYANAYRIPTEEEKPAAEQGYYLHPEVFGQPASKSIQAASEKASATDQLAKMSNP
jgi:hypothetical protein